MIGWMVFYILAIPYFSLYLPLYSFWAMDDFSWGNTRVVVGESGKKLVIHVSPVSSSPFPLALIKALYFKLTSYLRSSCRTRASLIPRSSRSSRGTSTRTSSGRRSRTIRSDLSASLSFSDTLTSVATSTDSSLNFSLLSVAASQRSIRPVELRRAFLLRTPDRLRAAPKPRNVARPRDVALAVLLQSAASAASAIRRRLPPVGLRRQSLPRRVG
jgi:hypothetical protein